MLPSRDDVHLVCMRRGAVSFNSTGLNGLPWDQALVMVQTLQFGECLSRLDLERNLDTPLGVGGCIGQAHGPEY